MLNDSGRLIERSATWRRVVMLVVIVAIAVSITIAALVGNEIVAGILAAGIAISVGGYLEQRRLLLARTERCVGDEAARTATVVAAALDPVVGTRVEVTAMRADQSEFPVELAITPIGRDGVQFFTAFLRDLTDRRLAEDVHTLAALVDVGREMMTLIEPERIVERLQELSRELLHCSATTTFVWSPVEKAFERHGLAPAEVWPERLERATIGDALTDLDRECVVPAHGWLAVPAGTAVMVAVALRRVGEIIGVHVLAFPKGVGMLGSQQHSLLLGIVQAAGIALTNAKLIADLTTANRIKSEFLSTMSHELRTPLNAILGYAEMAKDPDVGGDEHLDVVGRIEKAGRGLLELIEGALDIGKIEAGHIGVEPLRSVALRPWWAEVRDSCSVFPRKFQVVLTWNEPPDVAVWSDARKLAVVLRNLVGNALKFTEHGLVQVEASASESVVTIKVRDTGIGIRPGDHEAVFEMFRQVDGSESRRYGGAGLGLHIVRRFVEQLEGTIALDSALGQGSTFTLTLPIAGGVRPAATPESPRAA